MNDRNTYFIPHIRRTGNDTRILRLIRILKSEGYASYYMLLEVLMDQSDLKYPIENIDVIAWDIRIDFDVLNSVINDYGLFENDGKYFWNQDLLDIQKKDKPVLKQKTYIMIDKATSLYKIGRAAKPKYRERTLQSEKPVIELLYICDEDVEKELHDLHDQLRVRGEWFNLSEYDVDNIVDCYGFYPVNVEEDETK